MALRLHLAAIAIAAFTLPPVAVATFIASAVSGGEVAADRIPESLGQLLRRARGLPFAAQKA